MIKKYFRKIKSRVLDGFFILRKNRKISFSQCGEDLIVKFIFKQLGIQHPTYIDIGAHHPYYMSNTALFYENGCRGINIEPEPTLFKQFLKYRKKDVNLNIGISNCEAELDFYIISSPSLNTFSKEEANKYALEGNFLIKDVKKVKVNKLNVILNEFSKGIFPQFLSLDAEGVDELIIKEINFENNFPIVICIETISFSTSGNGKKNIELINYIKEKGYIVFADTYINTIFVKNEYWQKK